MIVVPRILAAIAAEGPHGATADHVARVIGLGRAALYTPGAIETIA